MLAPSVLNEDAVTVPDTTGRGNRSGRFRTHLSEKYRPAPGRRASRRSSLSGPANLAPRALGRLRRPCPAYRRSRRADAVARPRPRRGRRQRAPRAAAVPRLGGPSSRSRAAKPGTGGGWEAPALPPYASCARGQARTSIARGRHGLMLSSRRSRSGLARFGPCRELLRPLELMASDVDRVACSVVDPCLDDVRRAAATVAIRPSCRPPVAAGLR
jgi:hypothetical protein